MKLAITNKQEILELLNLCNEIETFYKELKCNYYTDVILSSDNEFFEILCPIWKDSENIEEFMTGVFKKFEQIHFHRVLWNCDALLQNCADFSLDYLDFNPKIKSGFEALELLQEIDDYLSPNPKNNMYCNSILHEKIKAILAKCSKEEKEAE